MTELGHHVAVLTGELTNDERDATLTRCGDGRTMPFTAHRFREGKDRVLITTNVLSRGIDVPLISLVCACACGADLCCRW